MNDLVKVKIVKDFWQEGKRFTEGEELILPQSLLDLIGIAHFEIIKALDKPPKNKMVEYATHYK